MEKAIKNKKCNNFHKVDSEKKFFHDLTGYDCDVFFC